MKISTLVIYLIPFFLKKSKKTDRCDRAHYRSLLNEIALENSLTSHFVFPVEFGLHTSYQLNTWSSFKLGMGYRYVIGEHEIPINGVYYKVGLGLNPNAFLTWFKEIRPIIDLFQSCGGFL